jgi:integrase
MLGKCLSHIRAVFNFAIEDELLEHNPALRLDMPPTRKESQRFLTPDEYIRLLTVAGQRDRLILRLFLVDGLRPGELFALRVNDIQTGELHIDQTVVDYKLKDGAKTEGSIASVPLSADLEAALRIYIRESNITDLLFPNTVGGPISPDNYLARVVKKLGVLANIDVFTDKHGQVNSRLNHQVLRRTTGTHFQKHGKVKDTQALLRHANPTTTLKHYQKVLEESVVRGVESWDAEISGGTKGTIQ